MDVAHQAPLTMGFPRQEYWSRLPFPPTGDLPSPGIEPSPPVLEVQCLSHWTTGEVPTGSDLAQSPFYICLFLILLLLFDL